MKDEKYRCIQGFKQDYNIPKEPKKEISGWHIAWIIVAQVLAILISLIINYLVNHKK